MHAMQRRCPFHHGKSHHSWCRTGNDTCLRKLCTMTVHWSFFNIDGLCFCGNKIACVFGWSYKWQRFPRSMKTSPYLRPESQHPWLSWTFLSARGQDNHTERNDVDSQKIKETFEYIFHQRVEALAVSRFRLCLEGAGIEDILKSPLRLKPFKSKS